MNLKRCHALTNSKTFLGFRILVIRILSSITLALPLNNSLAQTFIWPATDANDVETVRITQDYSVLTPSLKYHAGIDIGAMGLL